LHKDHLASFAEKKREREEVNVRKLI
jgi:hypothetical protein